MGGGSSQRVERDESSLPPFVDYAEIASVGDSADFGKQAVVAKAALAGGKLG